MSANPHGNRIHTVLVRPIYPRNTGMCSRAICNIGTGRLILIAPHFDPTTLEAREGAANGQRALREATVYNSLEEFYEAEGEGARIALTGKDHRLRSPEPLDLKLEKLWQAEQAISAKQSATLKENDLSVEPRALFNSTEPIYLIFGPEDDGLTFDDTKLAHHLCSLPIEGEAPSLNLSHAVLLTLFLVNEFLKRVMPIENVSAAPALPKKTFYPEKAIEEWLEAMGFSLDRHRVNMALTLHRVLLDHQPRAADLRMLDTLLHQTIRKIKR